MKAWLDGPGERVHKLFGELFEIGTTLMRVEDHLCMQIPGAERTLETMKTKLLAMVESIDKLIADIR